MTALTEIGHSGTDLALDPHLHRRRAGADLGPGVVVRRAGDATPQAGAGLLA